MQEFSSYKARVYYEDTDAGGIVYHSRYLNFCERARTELFASYDTPFFGPDFGFVVVSANCDFLSPLRLGDEFYVQNFLLNISRASFILRQLVRGKDAKLMFKADIRLALLCYKNDIFKPSPLPHELCEVLKTLQRCEI